MARSEYCAIVGESTGRKQLGLEQTDSQVSHASQGRKGMTTVTETRVELKDASLYLQDSPPKQKHSR